MENKNTNQNQDRNQKSKKPVSDFDSKKYDDVKSGSAGSTVAGNTWEAGGTLDKDTYGDTGTNTKATGAGTSGGFGSTGGSPESGSSEYSVGSATQGIGGQGAVGKKDDGGGSIGESNIASDSADRFGTSQKDLSGVGAPSSGANIFRSPHEMSGISTGGSDIGETGGSAQNQSSVFQTSGTGTGSGLGDTEGSFGSTNLGAKAGAGDNGAVPVSGEFSDGRSYTGDLSSDIGKVGSKNPDFGSDNVSTGSKSERDTSSDVHLGASKADMSGFGGKSDGTDVQGMIMKQIAELGDLLERAGEKIEQAGFSRIGDAIYRLGDRLEHLKGGKSGQKLEKADDSVEVDQNMTNRNDVSSGNRKKPDGTEKSQAY